MNVVMSQPHRTRSHADQGSAERHRGWSSSRVELLTVTKCFSANTKTIATKWTVSTFSFYWHYVSNQSLSNLLGCQKSSHLPYRQLLVSFIRQLVSLLCNPLHPLRMRLPSVPLRQALAGPSTSRIVPATPSLIRRATTSSHPSSSISPRITTLPNNLRVVTEGAPTYVHSLGVFIDGGTRFESERTSGVTHLLDKMAFKVGTPYHRPWAQQWSTTLLIAPIIVMQMC